MKLKKMAAAGNVDRSRSRSMSFRPQWKHEHDGDHNDVKKGRARGVETSRLGWQLAEMSCR